MWQGDGIINKGLVLRVKSMLNRLLILAYCRRISRFSRNINEPEPSSSFDIARMKLVVTRRLWDYLAKEAKAAEKKRGAKNRDGLQVASLAPHKLFAATCTSLRKVAAPSRIFTKGAKKGFGECGMAFGRMRQGLFQSIFA